MSGLPGPSVALWGADPHPVFLLAQSLRDAMPQVQLLVLATDVPGLPAAANCELKFLLAVGDSAHAEQRRLEAACRLGWGQTSRGYQVIHGKADQALAQAMMAINAAMNTPASSPSRPRRPWVWACEKCSDSDCEHRLLSDLLAQREAGAVR